MNATSSRWHKPKGRMTKRRRAQIENSRKQFSSSEVSLPDGSRNQRFEIRNLQNSASAERCGKTFSKMFCTVNVVH
ncbi:hypothetical protein JTE90_019633 [Oedothorax gibbosus]|uniref:Uncharacterized protein n=1 Tax=Oedothorax gibbosus TaxID=931172 RepID=A0AAV6TWN5_9ARAC|nr:hypothetical protein JTE90_019633 [Oedothorax gibbosus]